eukprot:UN17502
MNKLRKKIASEAAYTKDTLAKISKDTTAKLPLHRAVLPFLLKIDLKMEKEKRRFAIKFLAKSAVSYPIRIKITRT